MVRKGGYLIIDDTARAGWQREVKHEVVVVVKACDATL
jgi:hypothetical protein